MLAGGWPGRPELTSSRMLDLPAARDLLARAKQRTMQIAWQADEQHPAQTLIFHDTMALAQRMN